MPQDRHSAKLHLIPPTSAPEGVDRRRELSHAPLTGLTALLAVLGASCGGGDPEPAPDQGGADSPSTAHEGRHPGISDASQRTIDEIFGESPEDAFRDEPELPEIDAPLLAFERMDENLPSSGTWREHPSVADFDGDGRLDLVATNREEDGLNVWRNAPEGWVHRIEGLPRDLMYGGTSAADMDEDGDLDLVFGAHQDPGLHVFFNDGAMTWTMKPLEGIVSDALLLDVATGDLNGDGHLDVAGIGQFDNGVAVHLGDGAGGLTRVPSHAELLYPRRGTQIEFGDMDGDGLDDLVVASDRGLRVLLSRVDDEGAVTFEDRSEGLPVPTIGNSLRGLVLADFDEDGDLDIASGCIADPGLPVDEWNYLGLYRRKDDGSWEQFDRGLERRMSQHDVLAGDLDGDGHLDLIAVTSNSKVVVYGGDGTGGFRVLGRLPVPGASPKGAVGDMDGDGRLDVILSAGASKAAPTVSGVTVLLNRAEAFEDVEPAR